MDKLAVDKWVDENAMPYILGPLKTLISYQSASATHDDIQENALRKKGIELAHNHLLQELANLNFKTQLVELEGANPLVVGEYHVGSDKPTILFYGHYDVQGIDDRNAWVVDPFALEIKDGKMIARGIADDKGQMAPHFLAWKYFIGNGGKLPCNVKVIIEGNEESSSKNIRGIVPLDEYIMNHKDELACDAVMISDTSTPLTGIPAITTSVKGIIKVNAAAATPEDLVNFLDRSHDWLNNRVNYPDFYNGLKIPQIEPELEKRLDDAFLKEEGLGVLKPETGLSNVMHANFRPTHDPLHIYYVNDNPIGTGLTIKLTTSGPEGSTKHSGVFGGPVINPGLLLAHTLAELKKRGIDFKIDYFDYGSSTGDTKIYPNGYAQITITNTPALSFVDQIIAETYKDAGLDEYRERLLNVDEVKERRTYLSDMQKANPVAILSHRIVEGQDPENVYKSMLKFAESENLAVELKSILGANAYSSDTANPIHKSVKEAMKIGYNVESIETGTGGSIPVVDAFSKNLNVPVIFAGFAEPGEKIHEANEELSLNVFYAATRSMIHAYDAIGKLRLN